MIATIILIGLCLNLLIILSIWVSSKGLSETFRQLKSRLFSERHPKPDFLQSGTVEQFEFKIAPLEDMPAVSVFCPFPVTQVVAPKPSSNKQAFGSLRKLMSCFAKNLTNTGFTKLTGGDKTYLPMTRGLGVYPIIETGTPKEVTIIPRESTSGSNKMLNFSGVDQKLMHQHYQKVKTTSQPRSKLAVKLEKKLSQLTWAIEAVKKVPKPDLIASKLQKLEQKLTKKYMAAGKSVLPTVVEVGFN